MGCAASRKKFDGAEIAEAKPVPLKTVLPGSALLTTANTYYIKNRVFRIREDYDIKDRGGQVLGKLMSKAWSMRCRQTILDASGTPLALVQRKLWTLEPTFNVYSYQPAFPFQNSVDTDGDALLYRFAVIKSKLFTIPPQFDYFLYASSNDTPELVGTVYYVCSLFVRGFLCDGQGTPLCKYNQRSFFGSIKGAGTSEPQESAEAETAPVQVEVAAGMDPVQAVLIGIACQQLADER